MYGKAIVMAVLIAAMSTVGSAGSADNSTNASFFEGTWTGAWQGMHTSSGQEITITIGPRNQKGYNKTTYTYGWGKSGTGGDIPPGSFAVYGRERDGVFGFWWKDREGTKRIVTMEKNTEGGVKGKLEREGPATTSQRPFYEGIFKRK